MKALALYVLALAFLALILFIGWTGWRGAPMAGGLVVRQTSSQVVLIGAGGDTLPGIAAELGVTVDELKQANTTLSPTAVLGQGTEVTVPPEATTLQTMLGMHAAGLGAAFLGVFLSFWLALTAGILPKGYRAQLFGISFVLALASYAAVQAGVAGNPTLTPQFLFGALKDGFAWSTAFPMFAWALGFRERKATPSGPTAVGGGSGAGVGAERKPVLPDTTRDPVTPPPPPTPSNVS